MFSRLRKRFTYTNVAMTLALVFAMTGGAYAAKHYIITSTKQISPKVLTALKGKAGSAGKDGLNGKDGAPGAQGVEGKTGSQGIPGVEGKTGSQGIPGVAGPEGVCSTAGCKLPSGVTETGVWSGRPAEGEESLAVLTFAIPLASELDEAHVHVAPNAACPGTAQAPTAESGNLCVYIGENYAEDAEIANIYRPYGLLAKGAGTAGAMLAVKGGKPPNLAWGTWAVTG